MSDHDFLGALREELAYARHLIPALEWAVRVAQAKLQRARADLLLAELHQ